MGHNINENSVLVFVMVVGLLHINAFTTGDRRGEGGAVVACAKAGCFIDVAISLVPEDVFVIRVIESARGVLLPLR